MSEEVKKSLPGSLIWLLVSLALVLGALAAYGIPELLGGGQQATDNGSGAESAPVDLSDLQAQAGEAEAVLQDSPADTTAMLVAADAYLQMGMRQSGAGGIANISGSYQSFKTAADYYRRLLAVQPGDVDVRIDLGLTYFYLAMYNVAEREMAAAVQAAPLNQRAWLSLGWVQDTAGKSGEAKVSWRRAIEIDPSSPAGQEAQSFLDSAIARSAVTTP